MVKENGGENLRQSREVSPSDIPESEWEAPEGGWGYMVCVGLSVLFVSKI